jgi:hypothetical protein
MKTYGGVEVQLDPFLTLALDGRRVVSFTPRPIYHWERAVVAPQTGGWVGPTAGLDAVEKEQSNVFSDGETGR